VAGGKIELWLDLEEVVEARSGLEALVRLRPSEVASALIEELIVVAGQKKG